MENDEQYESYQPVKNGLLNSDGSVTAFDGTIISPANDESAEMYKQQTPQINKFLNPDGSIHTFDEISGGNKINVVQEKGQSTIDVMSQKSVTDALDQIPEPPGIVQTTGQSTTEVMSQKATTDIVINPNTTAVSKVKINSTTPLSATSNRVTLIDSNGTNGAGSNTILIGSAPGTSSSSSLICIGQGSSASGCSSSVLIGTSTSWLNSYSVAIGNSSGTSSSSCSNSTAVGNNTKVFNSCVSVGYAAESNPTGVVNSSTQYYNTAIGTSAVSNNIGSAALGGNTKAYNNYSTAVGSYATCSANYSVSLGSYSSTNQESVISVGNGTTNASYGKRRIINVANPINNQDAATKNYVDLRLPIPPESGNYVLKSNDGIIEWISESET